MTNPMLVAAPQPRVLAFDVNPLNWLGDSASAAVGDAWRAAMTALWSAGVWVLQFAFQLIDTFTTPDLSAHGPLAAVLPYTFYLGGIVATLTGLLQLGTALFRRDGQSIARILVGLGQFAAVWVGYIGVAALLVTATAGLTSGLLSALVHVNTFAGYTGSDSWPRQAGDTATATVLGLCTVFLIFPAAIGYILVMLVREAALMVLVATSPISAAGLLNDSTRAWFWKSLRWFISSLLIAPMAALVLGIGTKISEGVVAGDGNQTAAAVGMAVVGCVLMVIGAVSPLVLFRLMAFVDPGTPSGAAMRQSFDSAGGIAGLFSGSAGASGSAEPGSGASLKQTGAGGQSQGEASAATATVSRFSGAFGPAGAAFAKGIEIAGSVAGKATAISADVLASSGVGHPAPYSGQNLGARTGGTSGSGGGDGGAGASDARGDGGDGEDPPTGGATRGSGRPPTPVPPSSPAATPMPVAAAGAATEAAPLVVL